MFVVLQKEKYMWTQLPLNTITMYKYTDVCLLVNIIMNVEIITANTTHTGNKTVNMYVCIQWLSCYSWNKKNEKIKCTVNRLLIFDLERFKDVAFYEQLGGCCKKNSGCLPNSAPGHYSQLYWSQGFLFAFIFILVFMFHVLCCVCLLLSPSRYPWVMFLVVCVCIVIA